MKLNHENICLHSYTSQCFAFSFHVHPFYYYLFPCILPVRLDGCKYAIKKIHLAVTQARSPHSYARIMREVATLSNLQHPNVVRYFQASVCKSVICSGSKIMSNPVSN